MAQIETIQLAGKSTIIATPRGLVSRYVKMGIPLPQAVKRLRQTAMYEGTVNNLVVQLGKNMLADLLLDQETTGLTYHAIGDVSTTPVLADTLLGNETARKLWTSKIRTLSVLTFTAFYLASECTFNIQECGTFGGSTASATLDSGILFSHYLQAYDNSAGLVDLTFEYELTIG